MIKKDIIIAGVGTLTLRPDAQGVLISESPFSDSESAFPTMTISLTWEEMVDFEVLYEKCKEMKLKVFKPLAEALGVMYSNRTLYEALL